MKGVTAPSIPGQILQAFSRRKAWQTKGKVSSFRSLIGEATRSWGCTKPGRRHGYHLVAVESGWDLWQTARSLWLTPGSEESDWLTVGLLRKMNLSG